MMQAAGMRLDLQIDPDLNVVSDRRKIRQIITNLVTNAINYCRKGKPNTTVVLAFQSLDQGSWQIAVESGEQLKNGQVSAKPWKNTGGRPCRASGGRPGCSYLAKSSFSLPVYLWQCPWDSKMARARSTTSESYGSREYPEKRPERCQSEKS
jgi:hypothetical protein